MAKIFSIINYKGGTGKTTTTLNLGAALANSGYRVLLIDLDSQCNLSCSLGVNTNEYNIGNLMLNQSKINDILININSLSLIPASEKLFELEYQINNEPGREYLLKEALQQIEKNYDFILIDCAPSLGILSINSMVAANYFIVPMQAENYAFIGLDKILLTYDKVKKRMNNKLELAGILLVKFAHRNKFTRAVISNILNNEEIKNKLFHSKIRQDIALMESSAFNKTIFDYAPASRGADDYLSLSNEIIKKHVTIQV